MLQQERELINKLSIIILCAGEGTRLKEITKDVPKPLIKIKSLDNISILQHTINNLVVLGIERIAVVKGHLGHKIDEFISSFTQNNLSLKEKLFIIDSGNQYKLGPLYSFLSITKSESFFKNKQIYIVIPGDTIFQINLLSEIFTFILDNLNNIQDNPIIFYRKIDANTLKEKHKSKVISIVEIEKLESQKFLKEIMQKDLRNLSDIDYLKQMIPIFVFSYHFINKIIELEKKISAKTIREIINHTIREGKEIFAIKIDSKLKFYDIDYKLDLLNLK